MGLGALIWLSIILMPILNSFARSFYDANRLFFVLETMCVMAFAVSFILKGYGQPGNRGHDRAAVEQARHEPSMPEGAEA
jgi:hypothetical protein